MLFSFLLFFPSAVLRSLVLPFLHLMVPYICGCFPRPPPQMETSNPMPTCHPRTEVLEMEKRVWWCPKMSAWPCFHFLASSPPLAPSLHFPRWHLLLLCTPGILPPRILLDQALRAMVNGRRGSWYWYHGRWCCGVAFDLPWTPKTTFWLPSQGTPRENSEMHSQLEWVSRIGVRRRSEPLCRSSI